MLTRIILASAGLLLVTAGCQKKVYDIRLEPQGPVMKRTLDVHMENPSETVSDPPVPPPEATDEEVEHPATAAKNKAKSRELERIATLYPPDSVVIGENGGSIFAGTFTGQMPKDVGGFGRHEYLNSPLGSCSLYHERFRGNDDLAGSVTKLNDAMNEIADLAEGWIAVEFAGQPIEPRLQKLREDILRDAQNLSLLMLAHQKAIVLEPDKAWESFAVHAGQYLTERNYISITDVTRWARLSLGSTDEEVANELQSMIRRKLQIDADDADAESLAIFTQPKQMDDSLNRYLRTTPQYELALKLWESELDKGIPRGKQPEPLELTFGRILSDIAPINPIPEPRCELRLALDSPVKPFRSNGTWDEEDNVTTWLQSLSIWMPPEVVYASWSVPDTKYQTERFGFVALADEPLAKYVVWYNGLNKSEQKLWDDMLSQVQPTDNPLTAIDAFEFPDSSNLKQMPRRLIETAWGQARAQK